MVHGAAWWFRNNVRKVFQCTTELRVTRALCLSFRMLSFNPSSSSASASPLLSSFPTIFRLSSFSPPSPPPPFSVFALFRPTRTYTRACTTQRRWNKNSRNKAPRVREKDDSSNYWERRELRVAGEGVGRWDGMKIHHRRLTRARHRRRCPPRARKI